VVPPELEPSSCLPVVGAAAVRVVLVSGLAVLVGVVVVLVGVVVVEVEVVVVGGLDGALETALDSGELPSALVATTTNV
jgi:hypothetical protein